MEGIGFVLVNKVEMTLLVKLTTSRGGRKQWEYTEDLTDATKFRNQTEIDRMMDEHRVPLPLVRPRDYEKAFGEWLKSKETP